MKLYTKELEEGESIIIVHKDKAVAFGVKDGAFKSFSNIDFATMQERETFDIIKIITDGD